MKIRVLALLALVAFAAGLTTTTPASAEVDTDFGWDHRTASISGTYKPLIGQFAGDLATDILWYAPGSGADTLWIGHQGQRGTSTFTKVSVSVGGTYIPIVGDFWGDDYTDIFWYAPGTTHDAAWVSTPNGDTPFQSKNVQVNGTFKPTVLEDYTGANRKDDILWYAPGTAKDYLWHMNEAGTGTYSTVNLTINGTFQMVVGDWNGDYIQDLVLYAPGTAADYRWASKADGSFAQSSLTVNGTYQAVPIYQTDRDGIFWWSSGSGKEAYWKSNGSTFSSVTTESASVTGTVAPLGLQAASVIVPDNIDGVFVGTSTSGKFYQLARATHDIGSGVVSLVGDFDDDDYVDVLWYGAGTKPDQLWYTQPSSAAAAKSGDPHTRGEHATPVAPR